MPAEYVQPTPIPGPPPLIGQCPSYVETLKQTIQQCNADKADALEWSMRPSATPKRGEGEDSNGNP